MEVRPRLSRRCAALALSLITTLLCAAPLRAVDPQLASAVAAIPAQEDNLLGGLPPYLPKAPISGKLSVAGSSAMNQLAHLWADGLRHVHPDAKLDVAMFESGQVLPKLGAGEMEIGLMSRPLTEKELKDGGVVAIATAKDVLGVVVNPQNPLEQLTMEQGIKILQNPDAPENPGAKTWGDVGVAGPLAKSPINLYGRSTGTGAWGYLVNRFLGDATGSRRYGANYGTPGSRNDNYARRTVLRHRTDLSQVVLADSDAKGQHDSWTGPRGTGSENCRQRNTGNARHSGNSSHRRDHAGRRSGRHRRSRRTASPSHDQFTGPNRRCRRHDEGLG